MDRIQVQASKLWDLLFDDETAETYQKTLNLTGTILKEFAQLIWLTLISVFVFGAWFSDTSVKAGKSIRDWVDNKGTDSPVADGKPVAEQGKDLLEKGRVSVAQLLNQAREQLGLEPQEIAIKPVADAKPNQLAAQPAANPAAAKPAAAKTSQPSPAAKPAPTAAQKPPVSAQPSAAAAQAQRPAPASSPETSREDVESDWPPQEED